MPPAPFKYELPTDFPRSVLREYTIESGFIGVNSRRAMKQIASSKNAPDFGPEHADTFRRDLHPDLRADWQIASVEVRMWN
ncbi:MAG TPA: hypothetical protein PK490_05635 [Prosthecobacter sp.]|nr:hypothetical protein [Prosthecobacter sp.]HRK13747.1 hypothetical protein [Prosthecobacter sp.]